jgi:hypothetical protein
MKNKKIILILILFVGAGVAVGATATNAPPETGWPDPNPLQPLFDGLAGKYGWLTTFVLVIGSLRILFKPIMLALENYVRQTPRPEDDARLAKFEAGWIYKTIAVLLDFGASIKLPSAKPPAGSNQQSKI